MNHVKPVLRTHLSTSCVDHDLRRLLTNLSESAKYIKVALGTPREDGQPIDELADGIILKRLGYESSFGILEFASEEQDSIIQVDPGRGRYSVTVDPLDGGSLADVNMSVGSIFGVHDGPLLGGLSGEGSMVAAMYVLYGPETTLVYSAGQGVHEFVLDGAGNWVLRREHMALRKSGRIYAPGGMCRNWPPAHRRFIEALEEQGRKLRYSGALVPDVNHMMVKGGGVFSYPGSVRVPHGRLRLVLEAQPLAFIFEAADGMATDGRTRILDKVPGDIDDRTPLYIGSKAEVRLAGKILGEQAVS